MNQFVYKKGYKEKQMENNRKLDSPMKRTRSIIKSAGAMGMFKNRRRTSSKRNLESQESASSIAENQVP